MGSIVILTFSLVSSHTLIASVLTIFNYRAHQKKLLQLIISNSLPSFIYQDSPSKKVNKVGLEIVIASKDDYV